MGLALETVDANVSAAAATGFQAFAAGSGQSLSVRAASPGSFIGLEAMWANITAAGYAEVKSPRLHDVAQGIALSPATAASVLLANEYFEQPLYSQDLLNVGVNFTAAPGAASIQHMGLQVWYADLPGEAAVLRTWAEVQPNILEYVGIVTIPTSGAGTGTWGAGVSLASTFDVLKANQLYAVIGYDCPTAAAVSVALQGPDTGNLLCGGPATGQNVDTRNWFVDNANQSGRPMIPVINSANKNATLANVVTNAAATAATITWLMARLSA